MSGVVTRLASVGRSSPAENWQSTPYGLLSSTTARPARSSASWSVVAALGKIADNQKVSQISAHVGANSTAIHRRSFHAELPARQGTRGGRQDHGQLRLQHQGAGRAHHPLYRRRRHGGRHHAGHAQGG